MEAPTYIVGNGRGLGTKSFLLFIFVAGTYSYPDYYTLLVALALDFLLSS